MKHLKLLSLSLFIVLAFNFCSLDESTGTSDSGSDYRLFINEYLASNDSCCTDEYGEYDDWFEIYNMDSIAIDIGGMYVSDSKNNYKHFQIPKTDPVKSTIQPGGFLVIWCDNQPEQGVLHTDFALSGSGEDITLVESDGRTVIDELTYEPQTTDISTGRFPDGSDHWQSFAKPTPGASNSGPAATYPPEISNISVSPDTILAGQEVTIMATITDPDGDLVSGNVYYGVADSITNSKTLTAAGDDFSATIGPFSDGQTIYFFISAQDGDSHITNSDTLSFQVNYVPPTLFINEFLASNDSCCTDENDEYDDWIEIYNPNDQSVDIGGMYVTDDLTDLTAWQIPTTAPAVTTIPAKGFLVLWADKQPDQGVLHVNIKLSGDGEAIGLTAPNGVSVIDSLTFGPQTTDVSEGRQTDGSDTWVTFTTPTPGASNN